MSSFAGNAASVLVDAPDFALAEDTREAEGKDGFLSEPGKGVVLSVVIGDDTAGCFCCLSVLGDGVGARGDGVGARGDGAVAFVLWLFFHFFVKSLI